MRPPVTDTEPGSAPKLDRVMLRHDQHRPYRRKRIKPDTRLITIVRYIVANRPNIVYFHVDNLGLGELGCFGGGMLRGADTKRIDRFAEEALKLSHFVANRNARQHVRRS